MNPIGVKRHRGLRTRFLLIVTIAAVVSLIGWVASTVTVQSVVCREDQSAPCAPEIVAELDRLIGQRIFFLPNHAVEEKIRHADPSIASVHLATDLGKREVLSSVTRRRPVVRIAEAPSSHDVLLVDQEGITFEVANSVDDLPLVLWDGFLTLTVGQKVPEQLGRAVGLIRQLQAMEELIGVAHVRSGALEATTHEGTLVTFSLDQDPAQQLATLQLVLNQSRMEGVIYRSVDLRYQHPIVTK